MCIGQCVLVSVYLHPAYCFNTGTVDFLLAAILLSGELCIYDLLLSPSSWGNYATNGVHGVHMLL